MVRPVQHRNISKTPDLPPAVFPCLPMSFQHADSARHAADLFYYEYAFTQRDLCLHDTHRRIVRAVGMKAAGLIQHCLRSGKDLGR